jgi:hypothetical protein
MSDYDFGLFLEEDALLLQEVRSKYEAFPTVTMSDADFYAVLEVISHDPKRKTAFTKANYFYWAKAHLQLCRLTAGQIAELVPVLLAHIGIEGDPQCSPAAGAYSLACTHGIDDERLARIMHV